MTYHYRRGLFHRSIAELDCLADGVVETLDYRPFLWIDGLRLGLSLRTWEQNGDSLRRFRIPGQHAVRRHSLLAGARTRKHRPTV